MKMISQQAVGKSIRNGNNMFFVQFQEILVVAFLNENILAIRAAVVDVIIGIVEQRGGAGHEENYIC
jgi:hypothetical protein